MNCTTAGPRNRVPGRQDEWEINARGYRMTADIVVFTVAALGMLATAGGVFAMARHSRNQVR
ncbi:hypothetical protein GCM10009634_00070 [Saccharothrix xinjiangensis]